MEATQVSTKWISKIWYMHTAEYYSALKRNDTCYNMDETWGHYAKSKFSSVAQSCPNSLQSDGQGSLEHARLPCPSPTPGAYTNSCPSSQWCHPIISSSVVPFSSQLQSFPEPGSFQMNQFLHIRWPASTSEFQLQHQSFQWILRTDFL